MVGSWGTLDMSMGETRWRGISRGVASFFSRVHKDNSLSVTYPDIIGQVCGFVKVTWGNAF